jgi:hypothetical protein
MARFAALVPQNCPRHGGNYWYWPVIAAPAKRKGTSGMLTRPAVPVGDLRYLVAGALKGGRL